MVEGVFVHEAIKVRGQCTGDFRGATGAGAIHQPLDPLVREAMDPLAQGGIGKVQRVGHRLEALAFDNLAHGLGTTEDPGFLRLLEIGIQGGEGLIRKVEFESPHRGVSRKKLLQKFTRAPCLLILLSEQDLSDSNFPGAAIYSSALLGGKGKKVLDLERRQIRRELPQTEKRKLPVLHDATLARQMRVLFGRRSE